MSAFETVEVTLKVRMTVWTGGAWDEPLYAGQEPSTLGDPNNDMLYWGPTADEAARREIANRRLAPKKLGFFDRLFYNRRRESAEHAPLYNYDPEIVEVVEMKVLSTAYAGGE
jgi:hypothetical protein